MTEEALPVRVEKRTSYRTRRLDVGHLFRSLIPMFSALLVMLPGYFIVATALKTQTDYSLNKFGFPDPIFLGNFETAMRGGRFLMWFTNSTILALGAVFVSTAFAAMAAFAMARMQFPFRDSLLSIVTALMVIPPVVMIVPLFIVLTRLNLTSTRFGVIMVYAGLVMPFSVYLLTNTFRAIPHELIESALIDGATTFDVLWRILIPLSAPALITLMVVNTLFVWNDLLVALVLLPKDELRTLMVGVTVFGSRYNRDVPVAMMGMLLASLPMIVVYIFGQRFFIRGLTAGGLKG